MNYSVYLWLCVSFLITALGHFNQFPLLGVISSLCGYSFFWKGVTHFENAKTRFFYATLWFSLLQAIYLFWMTSIEFQGIYILFVYGGLILLLGVQWGLTTLLLPLTKALTPLTGKRIILISSIWTLMEWMRLFILCGFTFNPIGLSLASSLYPLQWASLWGVLGLTFWVMLVNLFFL